MILCDDDDECDCPPCPRPDAARKGLATVLIVAFVAAIGEALGEYAVPAAVRAIRKLRRQLTEPPASPRACKVSARRKNARR